MSDLPARLLDADSVDRSAPTLDATTDLTAFPSGSVTSVIIKAGGVKLTVVADPTVDTLVADGPHALRQDGVLVPGGFGSRGWEAKITACQVAREREIPYLGICLGMHVAVSEFARNVCGLEGANSSEFDPATPHAVIDLLPEQKNVTDMGATMRLGAQPCYIEPGTLAAFARLTNVGTVALRSDLEYERFDTPQPRLLWAQLAAPVRVQAVADRGAQVVHHALADLV